MTKRSDVRKKLGGLIFLLAGLLLTVSPLYAAGIFTPNDQPVGHVPKPSLSSNILASGTETVYQTYYEKTNWSGNLLAYPILSTGSVSTAAERWTDGAASQIASQNYNTGRKIVTMSGSSKVTFRWANLSSAQQDSIDAAATRGEALLNFIRGDRSNETPNGEAFRARTKVLGDIVHSRPRQRDGYIYVGSNDGMLHVINSSDGSEVWAYIPSMLVPNLKKLAADPYVHNHYVDGSPIFGLVTIGGASKKVIVGGLGAGGKGLYALDVTTPLPTSESDAADKILWEVTSSSTGFSNLGYTYSAPSIGEVLDNSTTPVSHQSAVIVGNGYLNSGNKHASLLIIDISDGSLIREIDTGSGNPSSPNGLSTPRVFDYDGDGIIDYAYAGDVDGNMWKFDLTDADSSNWTATNLVATGLAITSSPAVARRSDGGVMVTFGTGRMLTTADKTDNSVVNYAYGVWDAAPVANNTFQTQTLTERTWGADTKVRTSTMNAMDWTDGSGNHKGWKVALPAGERVVGDGSFIASGRFYFTSTNPTTTHADLADGTIVPDGDVWLMELNYLHGGGADYPFLDLSGDHLLTDADRVSGVTGVAGVSVAKYVGEGTPSQPALVRLNPLNSTLFNINSNADPLAAPPANVERGVVGGHFDYDIHHGNYVCGGDKTKGGLTYPECKYDQNEHVHQYDDKFDVTGVNMQNASEALLNLSNAISDTSTEFKVLMSNQALSPAVVFDIGGLGYEHVYNYGTQANLQLADLPTYSRATLNSLVINMPVNAFTEQDWGTGKVKAGLMPTVTSCVKGNYPGLNDAWRNGALTIQIIKANTPQNMIEENVPLAGSTGTDKGPEMGYRLVVPTDGSGNPDFTDSTNTDAWMLVEYTIFWHHKTLDLCYGASGWTDVPGEDTVAAADAAQDLLDGKDPAEIPAVGAADPYGYDFTAVTGEDTAIDTVIVDNVTTTTYQNATSDTKTVVTTVNEDGSIIIVTTDYDGTETTQTIPAPDGDLNSGGEESGSGNTGRISWRQLLLN